MSPVDSGAPKRPLLHLNTGLASVAVRLAPPLSRVALALPFLRSGLTRWDGFLSLSVATQYLFEEQFKLHILGAVYPLPAPDTLALLTACGEIVLPVLLLLGLATRLAALGLLLMTAVIQLVFPDGWMNFHLYWAALALSILALGPGRLSIDYWLGIWLRPGPR
ncbi:DoxX family membrane protein [Pseudomonas citronellolis]|uniref:DoxX family membrane protein n=1 Tax=Pseudomonas citronellolis TaxID=53408 RepID=UPI0023E47551|nr:DoxX family membrane protein [Pseudomonas citronellolis]MDF3931668.1 DoxX family membrane protein [Pseudomonas citronellolis]